MELIAGGKTLAEVKIQRGIFHGDARSTLLFETAWMPQNHILRKCTRRYKFEKIKTNDKSPRVQGRHPAVSKKGKRMKDSDTNNTNIQPGYKNGIWHRKMYRIYEEKSKKKNNSRNKTSFYYLKSQNA